MNPRISNRTALSSVRCLIEVEEKNGLTGGELRNGRLGFYIFCKDSSAAFGLSPQPAGHPRQCHASK